MTRQRRVEDNRLGRTIITQILKFLFLGSTAEYFKRHLIINFVHFFTMRIIFVIVCMKNYLENERKKSITISVWPYFRAMMFYLRARNSLTRIRCIECLRKIESSFDTIRLPFDFCYNFFSPFLCMQI
jgi:hypothetical protein